MSKSNFKIDIFYATEKYTDDVVKLADCNSKTLGFFPKNAFPEFISTKRIICAFSKKELIGYLLFDKRVKENLIAVVHLCVDENWRGFGVGSKLFRRLVEDTSDNFRAIKVKCRKDYGISDFWGNLGFSYKGDVPGRSKKGSILEVWWFDNGHPDLFTEYDQVISKNRIKVVVDANIYFSLINEPTEKTIDDHILLSDWFIGDYQYCLTSEIKKEISKESNGIVKIRSMDGLTDFTILECDKVGLNKRVQELDTLLSKPKSLRDIHDYNHLAISIENQIQVFLTHDKKIVAKKEVLYEKYGMQVLEPYEFIAQQDLVQRQSVYQSYQVSSTSFKYTRFDVSDMNVLDRFVYPNNDKKNKLIGSIKHYLSYPNKYYIYIIYSDEIESIPKLVEIHRLP